MNPGAEEGPLPRLDALLRRASEWLLVGDTLAKLPGTTTRPVPRRGPCR